MHEIKLKRFSYKGTIPRRGTICSAGYDLYSAEKVEIPAWSVKKISTDIGFQIDRKLVGKSCSRSSLSLKQLEAGTGVIDSGYRGVVYVVLHILSHKRFTVNVGDKIAQLLFEKISLPVLVEVLDFDDATERGTLGFVSTDI